MKSTEDFVNDVTKVLFKPLVPFRVESMGVGPKLVQKGGVDICHIMR